MKRRGQVVRFERVEVAVAIEKMKAAMPLNVMIDAEAMVKIEQAGAAAHQHVLTVVEQFAGIGIDKAGRPPAEAFSRFDERDARPALRQAHGRGDAGDAPAEDGDFQVGA
jgi:hypothetical protein